MYKIGGWLGYIFLVFLVLALLGGVNLHFFKAQDFWGNVFLIATVLFLPFIDTIFTSIKREALFKKDIFDGEKYMYHYIFLLCVLFSAWYGGVPLLSIITLGIFLWGILFTLNPKIAFLGALVLFLYIILCLLLDLGKLAESLSIYAYYFLIIGVVLQIVESLTSKYSKLWK